jgi:hypothetical protein
MLSARVLALLLGAAAAPALGACGSGDQGPDRSPAPAGAAARPAPASSAAPTRLPAGAPPPVAKYRFDEHPAGFTGGDFEGAMLAVRARSGITQPAVAPHRARPATRFELLETEVVLPETGAAGLFCRGSAGGRSGYRLLVARDRRWRIERVDHGAVTPVGSGRLDPNEASPPQRPTLLRLVCGSGAAGRPATLGFTVNARPLQLMADRHSLRPPGHSSRVGLVVEGADVGTSARFANLAVTEDR